MSATRRYTRLVGTERLVIHGAREHNLKNVTLDLPRNQLIVFTGLSGSGKSSLAFDTIYAEGQRRYVESLSSYARQFLGQMEKPDVDFIEGLSPAISIDQKSTSRNPRSTVGTITEVYDYLRVLFARIGHPHCYNCGRPIGRQTPDQIVDQVLQLPEGTRFQVLAPVVRGRKGEYEKLLQELARKGFPRARIDGEVRELSEPIRLPKNYKHTIEVVVDRLVAKQGIRRRVADSIETALELAEGIASIAVTTHEGHEEIQTFSQNARVHVLRAVVRRAGASELLVQLAVRGVPRPATGSAPGSRSTRSSSCPIPTLSINEGALAPWASNTLEYWYRVLEAVGDATASRSTRRGRSSRRRRARWCSTAPTRRSTSATTTGTDASAPTTRPTKACSPTSSGGTRRPTPTPRGRSSSSSCARSRAARARARGSGPRPSPSRWVASTSPQLTDLSIRKTLDFLNALELSEREEMIAERLLKEIRARLGFLVDVGLDYLTLSRPAGTLAGGEAQRIRLATQIGSGLVGVLYILDEPSIGLHQRDNRRLLDTLIRLRDLGNTLIVVEHDEATIIEADHIVDIGPLAGEHGGEIVYSGDLKGLLDCEESLTGAYLSGRRSIPTPASRRKPDRWLRLEGVRSTT